MVVPVIFELLLCGGLFVLLSNAFNEQQAELHQRLVATNATDQLLEYYALGFSMSIKPAERSWREFETALHNGQRAESRLLALTADDPKLSSIFQRLGAMFEGIQSFGKHAEMVVQRAGVGDRRDSGNGFCWQRTVAGIGHPGDAGHARAHRPSQPAGRSQPSQAQCAAASARTGALGWTGHQLVAFWSVSSPVQQRYCQATEHH